MKGIYMTILATLAAACGFASASHDKLGWMDNDEFTAADRARITQVASGDMGSNVGVIRAIQGGLRGSVTRRDFELLRQDQRRARAAYPDVTPNDLTQGAWLNIDMDAKIPESFCGSGNSNGTRGDDGKVYLDGGCYVSVVKAEYSKRADAAITQRYFADLKAKEKAARIARLKTEGPFAMWGGTDGSMDVHLDKATNEVVVLRAQEWASIATEWRIPFVPEEWADTDESDLDAIKKLPSFVRATSKQVVVTPSGVTITMGSSGVLMPGETVTQQIQLR